MLPFLPWSNGAIVHEVNDLSRYRRYESTFNAVDAVATKVKIKQTGCCSNVYSIPVLEFFAYFFKKSKRKDAYRE